MKKTPLEDWIRQRVQPAADGVLTRSALESYQLTKLREAVGYARKCSPFYRQLLGASGEPENLESFASLPFTTAADLQAQGMRMLCTSLDRIERVVTLQSSGTTGPSKRVFFTEEDLESTVEFFSHGMATMVEPGETVIVFLPGGRPGSVGDLLARALTRTGVQPVVFGPIRDLEGARQEILRHPACCLVGIPTQILSLARLDAAEAVPRGWVNSVLLSTDYVSRAIRQELERLWGCRVFTHYGLTETGLGGGVECEAGDGYHLREADLYTEIVDPVTGRPVADGEEGEVVFTTLTRVGMPLLRYRTGDRARMLSAPCPCGTLLKRLGRVGGRIQFEVSLRQAMSISMSMLDEALFPIVGLLDFTAEVAEKGGRDQLHLCLQVRAGDEERIARKALAALLHAEPVASLFREKALSVGSITFDHDGWFSSGVAKRRISDRRVSRPAPQRVSPATHPIHLQRIQESL